MTGAWLYWQVHGKKPPRRARRSRGGKGPARSWKYRAWIRTLPCCSCGTTKGIEAAHTETGGTAQKADDRTCAPLCADCHRLGPTAYHTIGRKDFERRRGLDLAQLVKQLNREWKLGKEQAA